MNNSGTTALSQFISDYSLRGEGLVVFDAMISFYKENVKHIVFSQVQIITLPTEIAVYINEFFKEGYKIPEMYNTAVFQFSYMPGKALEISNNTISPAPLVSILPLEKN